MFGRARREMERNNAFENNTHARAPQFVSVSARKHLLHMPIGDASASTVRRPSETHQVLNHSGRILVRFSELGTNRMSTT